jgi:hypothetical protein
VRMVLRALMLMNVQKRCLQKRKRQHQVHQDGYARPHTHIVPFYWLQSRQSSAQNVVCVKS